MRAVVTIAFVLLVASAASAQPAVTPAQLNERARAEVAAGHLPEARDLLRQSLEAERSPTTAFNLGLVLHDMGQLVAARDLLERVLAGEYGTLASDRVARTQEMIRTITPRIGALLCTVRGAPETEVWIDGTRAGVALDGAALRVPVDPGEHVLRFAAAGRSDVQENVRVDPGVVVPLSIAFPPPAAAPDPEPRPRPREVLAPDPDPRAPRDQGEDGGGSVFASPWLWLTVAVVAAAATVTVVFLTQDDGSGTPSEMIPGGYIGRVETLRF